MASYEIDGPAQSFRVDGSHAAHPDQLPIWPEPRRGGPNALLRSALFAGILSRQRVVLGISTGTEKEPEGEEIAAQDGIKLKYAGTQLNQYDADVFFEAVHRARKEPLGTECTFSGADFLKAIGRTRNDLNYEDLDQSLKRLRRGELETEWDINGRHYIFTGSLISHYVRETTTKLYRVSFAREIRTLFATASWTQLEWEQRKALKGKPLAQWLHSYASTHAVPFPVSVAFLHDKSGSPTKKLKHFKVDLKRALDALQAILGWKSTWDKDLVTIIRPPSSSQARYIQKASDRAARTKKERVNTHRRKHHNELTAISDILPGILGS